MFARALILAVAATNALPQNEIVWHWDRDTQVCHLRQDTADGESFAVERTPGNSATGVSITTKLPSNVRTERFDNGFIELTPGGRITADVSRYVHGGKLEFDASTKDPTFMAKLSTASAVAIGHGKELTSAMPLQAAKSAADAMHDCEDQKMRAWGIDPVAWRALKSTPDPVDPLWKRMSDADYPPDALSFLATGDAVTRLDIGPDGKVKQCRSLNASQYKGFEYATCNVLKGALFRPALDSAGHPVSAPYVIDVSFLIPS